MKLTTRAISSSLAVAVLLSGVMNASLSARDSAPPMMPSKVVLQHLRKNVPPVYPAIARAANMGGVVRLLVTISEAGDVQNAKIVQSAGVLDQAALDAVAKWTFEPFIVNGAPRQVQSLVNVRFGPGPSLAETAVSTALETCALAEANGPGNSAIRACTDLLPFASGLGWTESYALVLQGRAFASVGRYAEALDSFDRALNIGGQDSAALLGSARAREQVGDLVKAAKDYDAAGKRLAIGLNYTHSKFQPTAKAEYCAALGEYAALLDKIGRVDDARKTREKIRKVK